MNHDFASATILLLLITDPVGNIPLFASLLLTFMFIGQGFLRLMNLSDLALQIGGGIILFLIALRMVFPSPQAETAEITTEPLVVPLAIPAVAGPSALATVLLLVAQQPDQRMEWIAALSVTMLVCAAILLAAERILRVIGTRMVMAVERLMGLVLVSVAVEMMLRGVRTLALQLAHP